MRVVKGQLVPCSLAITNKADVLWLCGVKGIPVCVLGNLEGTDVRM